MNNINIIKIPVDLIERLDTISSYNCNYYLMSGVSIDDCNVLADVRGVSEDFDNYEIGYLIDGKFVGCYFLHIGEVDLKNPNESLIIHSDQVCKENLWT